MPVPILNKMINQLGNYIDDAGLIRLDAKKYRKLSAGERNGVDRRVKLLAHLKILASNHDSGVSAAGTIESTKQAIKIALEREEKLGNSRDINFVKHLQDSLKQLLDESVFHESLSNVSIPVHLQAALNYDDADLQKMVLGVNEEYVKMVSAIYGLETQSACAYAHAIFSRADSINKLLFIPKYNLHMNYRDFSYCFPIPLIVKAEEEKEESQRAKFLAVFGVYMLRVVELLPSSSDEDRIDSDSEACKHFRSSLEDLNFSRRLGGSRGLDGNIRISIIDFLNGLETKQVIRQEIAELTGLNLINIYPEEKDIAAEVTKYILPELTEVVMGYAGSSSGFWSGYPKQKAGDKAAGMSVEPPKKESKDGSSKLGCVIA